MRKTGNWGYFTYPMFATALFFALYLGGMSVWQEVSQRQEEKSYVSTAQMDWDLHTAELRALPATEVIIPAGPKGYISYFWVKSGASSKYSLDEYKAVVKPLSRGALVGATVEGDHFLVPWPGK